MTASLKKVLAVLPRAGEAAKNKDFTNCIENGLGLREWLESRGCEYITTDSKEGSDSELDKLIPSIDCLITTPFHPAYMNKERLQRAKNLQLVLVAGIGSDHIDLDAAVDTNKVTVAECTGSNVDSVAEDVAMRCLILMRNFLEGYKQAIDGELNVAAVAQRAYDIQDKVVGTVGGGAIGVGVMERLKGFGCKLVYYGRHEKPAMKELGGVDFEPDLEAFVRRCDIVTVNIPLTNKTRSMFNDDLIGKMKKGAYLVNNARGAICDHGAVVRASESGQLGGYSGDVWPQQPAPKDDPWRTMPHHAMTPHLSGITMDAQRRIAAGIREMLEQWMEQKPFTEDNYIVREGQLASQYS